MIGYAGSPRFPIGRAIFSFRMSTEILAKQTRDFNTSCRLSNIRDRKEFERLKIVEKQLTDQHTRCNQRLLVVFLLGMFIGSQYHKIEIGSFVQYHAERFLWMMLNVLFYNFVR